MWQILRIYGIVTALPLCGKQCRDTKVRVASCQTAVSDSLHFLKPLCLTVKYALSFEFRELVEQMQDCKIKNVIEIKSGELLQYWIECPKEKENEITDMAFMTWIKNPVFQKYYHDTRAFQKIAEKYVSEQSGRHDR